MQEEENKTVDIDTSGPDTEVELDTKQILYYIELKKAQKLLRLHKEPTRIIDAILNEISDLEKYS